MEYLDPFESYINLEQSRFDPLVDCFLAHYQFETIHPFRDGNGRVGRLLLSIMIQRAAKLTKPWLHMSEYFEERREEYYQGLYLISTRGAWSGWIEYCLRGVTEQANRTISRCERLMRVYEMHKSRLFQQGGSLRLQQIVDGMFEAPFIRVVDVPDKVGVTYPTAKTDLEKLVKLGILAEVEGLYPKTYYAPEVYGVAYEDLDS